MGECPACGAAISIGTKFCAECGTDVTSAAPIEGADIGLAGGADQEFSATTPMEAANVSTKSGVLGKPGEHPALESKARIVLLRSGLLTDKAYEIFGSAILGRFDPSTGPVDIDLSDIPDAATISRIHAQLRCTGPNSWVVKDLGSSNGTFFKAVATETFQRVEGEQPIQQGDEMAFGNARFRFEL